MEYRALDLTIISAKDLKNVNLFSKMDVYAVVSLAGDPRTIQRSPVDAGTGKNPSWNFPARFSLDESALQANRLVLHFVLRCDRSLGDKDVGEVHVPVKELLDAAPGKAAPAHFVSYQVRRPSGKPKGVLNISYKFGDRLAAPAPAPAPAPAAVKGGEEPVTAYPAGPSAAPHYPPPGSAAPYAPPPGAYPPQYGYPPQPAGYGYPPPGAYPPQYGYGAPPVQAPAKKNKNKFGMGLGAGLLGGALGGLLIGDMVSDAGAYDSGYDAGFDDGGGFDF